MDYINGIIMMCGINVIAVLGLCILTGFTGMFSFGHAGFMAIGAYTSAIVTAKLGLPFIMGITCGALAAAIASLGIGRLTLRLKGDYFCLATMGFGEAIRLVFNNWKWVGGAIGWPGLGSYTQVWNVLLIAAIAVIVSWNLIGSKHGRNMIAVREEELAAKMTGIDTYKSKMLALVASAILAGIAGALLAHKLTYISPKLFNMVKSTELTIMVIFGGLGSISGSVIGAVLLTWIPEQFRAFSEWRLVFYGLAVVLIMIGRPQGLMGGFELTPAGLKKHFKQRALKLAARKSMREGLIASAGEGDKS